MSPYVFAAGQADFAQTVIAASHRQPVLVDFWAPWCGPCRALKPLLEKLADEYAGRFLLAAVNSDENPDLATDCGVRSIPSVMAFVNGELVDEFVGALPEGQLRAFIDALLPSPADSLRAEAAALHADGQTQAAIAKLLEASGRDPTNEGVALDTAELLMSIGRDDAAAAILEREYHTEANRAQALRARRALKADVVGDEAALAERIAQAPDDLDARIQLARHLAARNAFAEAFETLLEVVRRDRNFADGIGRKTMLQLFELLRDDPGYDDLVRSYRRALSSLLN